MPYSNTVTTSVRLRSANFTAVYDKTGRDAAMSAKNEFDIGIRFQLPISVIMISGGYIHRSFALDLNGTGAKSQVQTGPYAGLLFGTEF